MLPKMTILRQDFDTGADLEGGRGRGYDPLTIQRVPPLVLF